MAIPAITTLFLDIGEVLLTNGWDTKIRTLAAKTFHLDFEVMETRHRLFFDLYESGKIDLQFYLDNTVFYEMRPFTREEFQQWMFDQNHAYPEMIDLIIQLKGQYKLKIAALSNEPRELNIYRIQKFKLHSFIDYFISSCFVHLRKPDISIFNMAVDIAQTPLSEIMYIDDRVIFTDIAKNMGMNVIHHTDYRSTREQLANVGLII